jgi:hypothetical protein
VLQCLPPHELLTAELVCQRWRGVATDHGNVLWRPLFDSSPYSRWWLPFRPSHDFTTLKGIFPDLRVCGAMCVCCVRVS